MKSAKLPSSGNPGCIKPMVGWMPKHLSWIRIHGLDRSIHYQENKAQYINSEPPIKHRAAYERMEFACKQCMPCRLNKSMEWAARICAEAQLYEDNCFVTLTYNDENLPEQGQLVLADLQNFKKRLRKKFKGVDVVPGVKLKPGQPNPIRTYECGEMGDQFGRPHYHLAIMNWKPLDLKIHSKSKLGDIVYTSKTLDDLWQRKGFVTVGDLNVSSASYISRYVTKKINGLQKEQHYERIDPESGEIYQLKPEFSTMSRRPGIGVPFLMKYMGDFADGKMLITAKNGNKLLRRAPQHFEDVIARTHPDLVEKLKAERKEYLLKMQKEHPEEFTPERRRVKGIVFAAKTKSTNRKMVDLT
jgi:hypothetical protein